MNYSDTLSWMFSQLPMYQNQGKSAYKKDLTNSLKLAAHLNNPQIKFKSIHVAGTNGKGSTCHIIASILQETGLKVGLYTSPHLVDFRERIKINGKPASKQFVIQFIKRNRSFLEENRLSFFEMTVGMAFDYFAKQKVDIAIIEVGLGGRLDSTNIISPILSVITNIGFDHMQFLGNSLIEIAGEKAGIIKEKVPVIIGETTPETKKVFADYARKMNSEIAFAKSLKSGSLNDTSDLKGDYQHANIVTALSAIEALKSNGFNIRAKHIKSGLKKVVVNTGLQGRWQVIRNKPTVICDVAHNKEGLTYVLKQLKRQSFDHLHIVVGFVKDKDLMSIINIFPKNAKYYYCQAKIERALSVATVKTIFGQNGFKGEAFKTVKLAYESALKNAEKDDLIFVGGSTFVVAEIL